MDLAKSLLGDGKALSPGKAGADAEEADLGPFLGIEKERALTKAEERAKHRFYMVSHGSLFCSKMRHFFIDLSQLRHLRHLSHLLHLRFCFQFYNPFARLWSGPQFLCVLCFLFFVFVDYIPVLF
jgi:hypothetical protein